MKAILFIKKAFTFLCFYLVLFFSCKVEQTEIPANIIPKDTMIAILVDINLLEAVMEEGKIATDSLDKAMYNHYSSIFYAHNISKENFYKSYHFYIQHPHLLDEIYNEVINQLNLLESKVQVNKN